MDAFSLRSFWLPVLLATLVAAFFGAWLARRGAELRALRARVAMQEVELARLRRQNAALEARRNALMNSPEAVEHVAREDYGMAAPGERVERMPTRTAPAPAPRPAAAPGASFWERLLTWPRLAVLVPAVVFLITALGLAAMNLLIAPAGKAA